MRQGLDVARRVKGLAVPNELVRGAFCAVLQVAFWFGGLHIALVLVLPILVYGGLWLMASAPPTTRPAHTPTPREIREAYANCLRLQEEILAISIEVTDPKTFDIVKRVTGQIQEIMDVIAEDRRFEICLKLMDPLRTTEAILSHFNKLVRREFDDAETQQHVHANLNALEQVFAGFREELNQDVIVDLETLGNRVDDWVKALPVSADIPALPAEIPESAIRFYPPEVAKLIESLTPREILILGILPSGKTDLEIAGMLFNSRRTVSKHLTNIYEKINVRNRAEATAFAVRWGLTPPSEPE